MTNIKNKNDKIQILRAIAIFAVIMIHTCPDDSIQIIIRPFINFSVALFLFLSGYLTNIIDLNWKKLYKKRIIRVIIPYVIWTILYTTAVSIKNDLRINTYIFNLLTTKSAPTLYYIFVYIQFVLLTPLLSKLIKGKNKYLGFLITPLVIVIKYYWLFNPNQINKYISLLMSISCLQWFSYYYLGLLFGNKIINKEYKIKKLYISYIISIIIQIIEGYIWFKLGSNNYGTQIKYSALLSNIIFILISYCYINNNLNYKNKFLTMIGNYSFGIYISHIMIILILKEFIPFWSKIPFGLNSLIVLFLSLIIVIVGKKICGDKLSKIIGLY